MDLIEFARVNKITLTHKFVGLTKKDISWDCFHWVVTLHLGVKEYTTDYFMGIGNCRHFWKHEEEFKAGSYASKCGSRVIDHPSHSGKLMVPTPPNVLEVLEVSQFDCSSGSYCLFEDFADDFGYNRDSRSAERIWHQCREICGHLQHFFGAKFDEFMECEV